MTALVGGSVGAIGATWLQGKHQRAEAWRDRLVRAADEFGTGVLEAIMSLRDANLAIDGVIAEQESGARPAGIPPSEVDEAKAALVELDRRVDDAHARFARLQILFGVAAESTRAGESAIVALRSGSGALWEWPFPDQSAANSRLDEAHESLQRFATSARAAIESGR
jgi:hypothetical protein